MELKPLHANAIQSAMEKANHYRLLNDPENAESICRDILEHDPHHQSALITLILSLTDQFCRGSHNPKEAQSFIGGLKNAYDQSYYSGLICEKAARELVSRTTPGSNHAAYDLFRQAMEHFEKAEGLGGTDNDDAILRWNSCVRTINKRNLERRPQEDFVPYGD